MLIVFTYLITNDIIETLENKGFCLPQKNKTEILCLETDFLNEFWQFVPEDCAKTSLNCSDLRKQLKLKRFEDFFPCVSLDPIYAQDNIIAYLSVTRITNPATGEKSIGSRPGTKPIERQIKEISEICSRINLVDCGAFEGDTLLEIIRLLEQQKISVEKIYLAVSSYLARDKISQKSEVITNNLFNFKEWVELRDLLGIDGRKVSETDNAFIPYWENLEEWASIPKENVRIVKQLCKQYNSSLIRILERTNGDIDKIGKLVSYTGRSKK